jgi:branched-chain amino acid transport system permease protein
VVLVAVPLVLVAIVTELIGGVVLERIVIVMFINLIMVVALQMFMGNSGVVSFGHVAFMGIGAYASALLSMTPEIKAAALRSGYPLIEQLHLPFIPALLGGAVVAAVVAAVIGFPLMRLSGASAVIATFALLVIVHTVLLNWTQLTNGPRIIFGVPGHTTLWVTVAFGLAAVVLGFAFKDTSLGLMLRASREEEQAAASIGINIIVVRWVAFVLSAFLTGLSGGLWAHFITIFSPAAFYLVQTFLIVTMLIVGGMGSVSGAVAGTVLITAAFEVLRAVENEVNASDLLPRAFSGFTEVMLATAMIVLLVRRPAGITGGNELRLPRRWGRRAPPKRDGRVSGVGGEAPGSEGSEGTAP